MQSSRILTLRKGTQTRLAEGLSLVRQTDPPLLKPANTVRRTIIVPCVKRTGDGTVADTNSFFREVVFAFSVLHHASEKNIESVQDKTAFLYLGLLCRMFPGMVGTIKEITRATNCDLELMTVKQMLEWGNATTEELYTQEDIDESPVTNITINYGVYEAYTMLLTLLLGKRVAVNSYVYWLAARIRGVASRYGLNLNQKEFALLFPDASLCPHIYDYFSSVYEIRAAIVENLLNLTATPDQTLVGVAWTVQMLAYSGCSHIAMIVSNILIRHPEVLTLPILSGEREYFINGMESVSKLPERFFPYYQLLLKPSTVQPLASNQLRTLTRIAWEISVKEGRNTQTQMDNYMGHAKEKTGMLETIMKQISVMLKWTDIEGQKALRSIYSDDIADNIMAEIHQMKVDFEHLGGNVGPTSG